MSSAPRGLAPREGLGSVLMKMGRAGPPFEPHRRPQAGKSGDPHSQNADKDDSDCGSKPSYKTLAKIATEQQKAMEHIQKLLDKSDDLLDTEMTRSQS